MVDETIKYPQMADAFPDFDQNSLPSIPPEWTDVSWSNDTCPSFITNTGWLVFIDYSDRALDGHLFYAVGCDGDGQITEANGSCATDNWERLLKWL